MLIVLGGLAAMVISAVYRGWVLMLLWAWFVSPTFGVPALRIPTALGVAVLVGMLTFNPTGKESRSFTEALACSTASTTVALVVGWIYSLFL